MQQFTYVDDSFSNIICATYVLLFLKVLLKLMNWFMVQNSQTIRYSTWNKEHKSNYKAQLSPSTKPDFMRI